MKLVTFGLSDKGKAYADNQDAFLVDDLNGLYAVADGIGGLPNGALASSQAIKVLRDEYLSAQHDYLSQTEQSELTESIRKLFNKINQAVYTIGFNTHPASGIGTTLTLVKIFDNHLAIGHIGDSAVLRIRDKKCIQWTTNHTMEQALRDGLSHGPALQNIPESYTYALTRCIGQEKQVLIQTLFKRIRKKDRVLICSDGITQTFSPEELHHQTVLSPDPETCVRNLINMANQRGGLDNITVIALFFE